jgi:hypothetical protein
VQPQHRQIPLTAKYARSRVFLYFQQHAEQSHHLVGQFGHFLKDCSNIGPPEPAVPVANKLAGIIVNSKRLWLYRKNWRLPVVMHWVTSGCLVSVRLYHCQTIVRATPRVLVGQKRGEGWLFPRDRSCFFKLGVQRKKENVVLSKMASTGSTEVKTEPVINNSAVSETGKIWVPILVPLSTTT